MRNPRSLGFGVSLDAALRHSGAMRTFRASWAVALIVAMAGCSSTAAPTPAAPRSSPHSSPTPTRSTEPPTITAPSTPPVRFDAARAYATVRGLAGGIGPRQATSPAYARAAALVETRLRDLGYEVRRQGLSVPAGVSWGVPVPAGRTWNVLATPPWYDTGRAYRLVGAHLDTVPQAPGAEDNASGVSVLLELARMAAADPPPVPVIFVAFGAEEPRGETDNDHHYGSRAYVERMTTAERRSLRGMVSLDRVGVGDVVPVCTAADTPGLLRSLLDAARRVGVPAHACENRSSDHWSFVRNGLVGVRVGGTPYAAYHSAADLPRVVDPAQLRRAGRLVWSWLNAAP